MMDFFGAINPYFMLWLAITIGMALYFHKRLGRMTEEKTGCVGFFMVFFATAFVNGFTVMAVNMAIHLKTLSVSTKYDAEIVDLDSYVSRDDDGDYVTMYTPIVKFVPEGATQPVVSEIDVSSSGAYNIGESHKVIYDAQSGEVSSAETGTVMLILMGLLLYMGMMYGLCRLVFF